MTTASPAALPRSSASSTRRAPALLAALLGALMVLGLAAVPAANAADRNFAPRFTTNDTGDIDIFGNTLMTCPTSAAGCAAAQQSGVTTTANSSSQNNAYTMQYIDVDSDATTFNSSRSTVTLPAGSTVLFAGLYWGARTAAGSGGAAARSIPDRDKIKFQVPGAATYASLVADKVDDGDGGIYQGFKDVTALVKAAGAGMYAAANVQASTGADTLAGWSLVIAYRDTSQPARNLTVFDGIKSISGSQGGSIAVSGFTTPPSGAVKTRVGFVTYEGDGGIVGDGASLNGTPLSDAQHPATNFFNSRSSRDGVRRTDTAPNYPNQLGIEQSILQANGILPNNATSATIGLTTSGDVYAPGVVTFATELYAPKVEQTKTVVDVNGGKVEQGDVLRYTISGTNSGQDGATNFILRDPIPANTTYVGTSLKVSPTAGGAASVGVSDATDSDRGEVDQAGTRVVARLGAGSNGSSGGTVPAGGTYAVTFDVTVNGPTPAVASNTDIKNVATASFASVSLGTPLTAQSNAAVTVQSPDLTITKTGSGTITRGQPYTYNIVVKNSGDAKTKGTVTVTDTLPSGLSFTGTPPVSGNGWACTNTSSTFTCTRSDALANGGSYPQLVLTTNVAANAPMTIANTATVSGGGDGDPSNNTGTATNDPQSSADLAVEKTADVTSVAVGGNVTYTLKVTNKGTSDSTGSVITDTLPAGLTYVSAANCTGSAGATAVTCNVGALAAGSTKTFTVVAKPAAGTAGTALKNTASVNGNEPDPDPTNNTVTETVDVKPVDLKITNTIQGSPATLSPDTGYVWLVGVTNLGGSTAPNSIVRFDVPAGTTVDAGLDARCQVTGTAPNQVIVCDLGPVAPDATPPVLQIPLKTTANPPASIGTVASVTTTENDVNLSNNTATTSTPVVSAVDLGVTLTSNPGSTSAGDTLTLTATVKNNGPATPQNPKVTIDVPTGTTIQSIPSNCTAIDGGTKVECTLDPTKLDSGETTTASIVVKVGPNPGPTIDTTAKVTTTSDDTDPSNDVSSLQVPTVRVAGLSITKSASSANAKPGDIVTYTLKASNAGPAAAQDVVIDDMIPAGTTFDSADAPCTFAGGKVSCPVGTIAAGDSRTVTVRVQVSPLAGTFDANATQDLDVQKKEVDVPVEAKATATGTVTCDAGYFATDGSARLESVDQGTGDLGSIHVRSSRATADGSGWTVTVENDATGRAQLKVTVVCLKSMTISSGHTHPLLVSAPITATKQFAAGRSEVVLTCGAGRVAVAPSYTLTDGATGRVSGSQREGETGWKFTVDVTEADAGTFSVRCLSTTTGAVDGHVHDLGFTQLNDTVDVPANQTGSTKTTKTLTCTNGKGIVGGSLVPPGLTPAGNDPQPVSRVFGFQNTTGTPLTANVGLLCLGIRTGGELGFANVVNTATVKTSTQDASTADDSASATFTATLATGDTGTVPPVTPAPRPVAPAAPVTAAPATPTVVDPGVAAPITVAPKASVLATSLRVTGTTSKASVAVPISCAKACAGTAKLVALGPVRATTTLKKGSVLATASLKLKAGKKTTIKLVAKGKGAKALRLGRVKKAQLVITTGKGTTVKKTVRISVR